MNKRLVALLLVLGIAPLTRGQETATPTPSDEATKRAAAIESEIADYTKNWRQEQRELRKKQAEEARKARAEGRKVQRAMSMRMSPDYGAFVDRFLALADEAQGEDQALYLLKAHTFGGTGPKSKGIAALDRLVSDHPNSPQWKGIGRRLSFLERALGKERLGEILAALANNPDGDVQGWVAFTSHSKTIENAELESDAYKASRTALKTALKSVSSEQLTSQINGVIELRENLGIGAVAPDIEGIDIDGGAFKLSDYKGKVIFLDFWGDW